MANLAKKSGAWWVAGIGGLAGQGMPLLGPHLRPLAVDPVSEPPAPAELPLDPAPAGLAGCPGAGQRARAALAAPAGRP